MIVSKDIQPERHIYYLGALVLDLVMQSPGKKADFFDIFQKLNHSERVSIKLFSLTLDWLFLLGAARLKGSDIEGCF